MTRKRTDGPLSIFVYINQFSALLWETMISYPREIDLFCLEIIVPLLLIFIAIPFPKLWLYEDTSMIVGDVALQPPERRTTHHDLTLYYWPRLKITHAIMTRARRKGFMKVEGFDSLKDFRYVYKKNFFTGERSFFIQFDRTINNTANNSLPKDIRYTIRSKFLVFWTNRENRRSADIKTEDNVERQREFLIVKHFVDEAIIDVLSEVPQCKGTDIRLSIHPFPKSPELRKQPVSLQWAFPLTSTFIMIMPTVAHRLGCQRECNERDMIVRMQAYRWMKWTARFYGACVMHSILSCFAVISCRSFNILTSCDPSVLFSLFQLWGSSNICLGFALSTSFQTSTAGFNLTFLNYVIMFVLFTMFWSWYNDIPTIAKLVLGFIPNLAMGWGLRILLIYDGRDMPFQWKNIFSSKEVDEKIPLAYMFMTMLFDCVFFLFLTYFVDSPRWILIMNQIFGTEKLIEKDATPLPGRIFSRMESTMEAMCVNDEDFEPHVSEGACGISMQSVHKRHSSVTRTAGDLRNVTFNIFQGDIFVILSREKKENETILNLVAGYQKPTSGTILLNGVPIEAYKKLFPLKLIWCLSQNIFIGNMTVKENLLFFAKLGGTSRSQAKQRTKEVLEGLVLEKFQNTLGKRLSAGLKRKLSIAITFINDPEIVILSEPTAGMDIECRAQFSEFLHKGHEKRAILILTQNLKEAHLLGNRFSVLNGGMMQCCGTMDFLNDRFGTGYQLAMTKLDASEVNVDQIMKHLEKVIPNARVLSNSDEKLVIRLLEADCDTFGTVFAKLLSYGRRMRLHRYELVYLSFEEALSQLEVKSMDWVDLKDECDEMGIMVENLKDETKVQQVMITPDDGETLEDLVADAWKNFRSLPYDTIHISGMRASLSHLKAIILKRFMQTYRAGSLLCLQFLASILPIILTMIFVINPNKAKPEPPRFHLRLSPEDAPQEVFIAVNSTSTVYDPQSLDIIQVYKQLTLNRKMKTIKTDIKDSFMLKELYKSCDDNLKDTFLMQCFRNVSSKAYARFRRKGKIAIVFSGMGTKERHELNIKLYYNEDSYHAAGINLNYISSAILNVRTKGKHTLSTFVQPFPRSHVDKLNAMIRNRGGTFNVAKYLIAMCIMASIWIPMLTRERKSKAKLILFLEGLHPYMYWYANFLFDYSLYTLVTAFYMGVSFTQGSSYYGFSDNSNYLGWLVILYLTFGFATIPLNYLSSMIFEKKRVVVIGFFVQFTAGIVSVIRFSKAYEEQQQNVVLILQTIFPTTCAARVLYTVFLNSFYYHTCSKVEPRCSVKRCCYELCQEKGIENCFDWSEDVILAENGLIRKMLIIMILQGCIYFILCLLSDSDIHSSLNIFAIFNKFLFKRQIATRIQGLLNQEETYYDTIYFSDHQKFLHNTLVAKDIWGQHALTSREVKNLSFTVKSYECFVVLGPNNSGKSTLVQMIVGDCDIGDGDLFLHGHSVLSYPGHRQKNMSYCPQTDVFFENLTGYEILMLCCRLRGIRRKYRKPVIAEILESFSFMKSANDFPTNYSPSNRRKMSVLLSLLGNPPLVVIDQPTFNISSRARKQIWACLNSYRARGGSLIVTSTRVEECDSIGTHTAMLYRGKFQCRGPLKLIKQHFDVDYILQMTLPSSQDSCVMMDSIRKVVAYMRNIFPKARLESFHGGTLRYRIKMMKKCTLTDIFQNMESHKQWLGILNYHVSKDSLQKYFSYYSCLDDNFLEDFA